MSRRKQARPSRATLEEDQLHGLRNNPLTTVDDQQPTTPQDENDTGSENEETHVTSEEAVDLTSNRSSHHEDDDVDDEREELELPMEEDEDEEDEEENNDNNHTDDIDNIDDEGSRKEIKNLQDAENNNSGIFAPAAGCTSHVTLEALQNTKVAVAQFAATALAGGADEAALQDLALLQSTLYTLQHQQVFQLQLISQLQQQLSITHGQTTGQPSDNIINDITKECGGNGRTSLVTSPSPLLHPKSISSLTSPPLSSQTLPIQPVSSSIITSTPAPITTTPTTTTTTGTSLSIGTALPSSASVAATLAATIASRPLLHQLNMITSSNCSTTSTSPVTVMSASSFTSQQQQQQERPGSNSLSPITLALPATSSSSCILTPSTTSTLSSSIIDTTTTTTTSSSTPTTINNTSNILTYQGLASISSSLASTIITNNDPLPLNEPNTLEMLQKRAQEVLDNASQGLLANNLADELAFRSGKSGSRLSPYDSKSSGGRGEPFFKHRCRYCGKVFGSDSALQIHIRSHTVRGNTTCNICYKTFACNSALEIHYRSHTKERPFKCTICDRGFSTKNDDTVMRTCKCMDQRDGSTTIQLQQQNKQNNQCGQSGQNTKSRRRRNEDKKNRGRTVIGGGRGALTSVCATSVHLPPRMPAALGLLASNHVFLGNMKQHMLTHKIRDMPSHLFGDSKQPGQSPQIGNQHDQQRSQEQRERDQRQQQEHENSLSSMEPDESSLPPPPPPPPPLPPPPPPQPQQQQQQPAQPSSPMTPSSIHEAPMPIKRSPTEGDLPAPKRTSMSSKHLCHVCNKNFSSSSALQIHMRTHTGDKPFRCTVCQKAFTTKGNLKVHMGTHMWTNGASRRGRRMSLDLPPLPITPKDSEFLQRRPDLFYPYLPGPGFLNGVQQKLSEISVIQGNNGLPVNHPAAGKYAGLFGSLYGGGLNLSGGNGFPMDKGPIVPSNNSHDDGKPLVPSGSMLFHTPSPSHSPSTPSSNTGNQNSASIPPPWNNDTLQHHFERDGPSRDNDNNESTSPPAPRLPPPTSTTRGEGLAA